LSQFHCITLRLNQAALLQFLWDSSVPDPDSSARGRPQSLFGDTVKRAFPQPVGQSRRLLPQLLRQVNPFFAVLIYLFETAACQVSAGGV
jgi:hypothetical protein